jgi:hypothetical protein
MRSNVTLDIGGSSSIIGSDNASHWTRKQSELVFPPECDGTVRKTPPPFLKLPFSDGSKTMICQDRLWTHAPLEKLRNKANLPQVPT